LLSRWGDGNESIDARIGKDANIVRQKEKGGQRSGQGKRGTVKVHWSKTTSESSRKSRRNSSVGRRKGLWGGAFTTSEKKKEGRLGENLSLCFHLFAKILNRHQRVRMNHSYSIHWLSSSSEKKVTSRNLRALGTGERGELTIARRRKHHHAADRF